MTRNRSVDLLRKKWRRQHEGLSGDEAAPAGPAADDSLRVSDEMSLEEISCRLEIPVGTVKSRLHYALALLRRRNPVAFLLLMALSDAAE